MANEIRRALVLAALVVAISSASAQSRLDFAFLSSDITVRTLDSITTSWILSHPNTREVSLPTFIAKDPILMAVYSESCVVFGFWTMRRLERHHPKWAHALMSVEIGQDGYAVVGNFQTIRWLRKR